MFRLRHIFTVPACCALSRWDGCRFDFFQVHGYQFSRAHAVACLHQFSIISALWSAGRGRSLSFGATCPISPFSLHAFLPPQPLLQREHVSCPGRKIFGEAPAGLCEPRLRTLAVPSPSARCKPTVCAADGIPLDSAFFRYSSIAALPRACGTRSRASWKTMWFLEGFRKTVVICFPLVANQGCAKRMD